MKANSVQNFEYDSELNLKEIANTMNICEDSILR